MFLFIDFVSGSYRFCGQRCDIGDITKSVIDMR